MKFLIDTANKNHIEHALSLGIVGITSNPSMYAKEKTGILDFIKYANSLNAEILTCEVMGDSVEEMYQQALKIRQVNEDIIIKINFSENGLELAKKLKLDGFKTAMTLIFNVNQATLAINSGADYLFFFIGRNDENGYDGLLNLKNILDIIKNKSYNTRRHSFVPGRGNSSTNHWCTVYYSNLGRSPPGDL